MQGGSSAKRRIQWRCKRWQQHRRIMVTSAAGGGNNRENASRAAVGAAAKKDYNKVALQWGNNGELQRVAVDRDNCAGGSG